MTATKKPATKKAKAPAKKQVAVTTPVKATTPRKRAPRKQPTAASQVSEQATTFTFRLVSVFAVLSVVFAAMAYWRYRM